jgi:hypothetical protein
MSDIRNVDRDPHAPRLGVSQLMRVRQFYPEPVLWACISCRWSEFANVQQRCPNCDRLMVRGEKA